MVSLEMTKENILILDFGSPYTQMLAQRVRENHVFSRVVPYNVSAEEIELQKPKGIIFSGGDGTSSQSKKPALPDKGIYKLKIPILGIAYGGSIIIQHFGGRVKSAKLPELRRCELFIDETRNLFRQMPGNITCLMSYADDIRKLPIGFKKTAHTQDVAIAAVKCISRKIFAVGFHPEVVITQRGGQVLSNFLYKICGCLGAWRMDSFIQETVAKIKKTVGKTTVVLNLTLTLKSFVVALLIQKAIGKKLKCFFIDHGLLRKDEARQIKRVCNSHFHLNLHYVDRSKRFFHSLKGITKPEEKKRIISNLFINTFQEKTKKVKGAKFLAEVTLYSEAGKFVLGSTPLKLKPLEPLSSLFNNEVRVVAKELGIPDNIIFRQPFPEAGLAVRIIGEVTILRLKTLREAQSCVIEEIKSAGIYEQVWQSFAILIPEKNIIAIRCIASMDGTTADWVRLPYDILEKISRRIFNKIKGIKRVVYDISSKPPATVEWE